MVDRQSSQINRPSGAPETLTALSPTAQAAAPSRRPTVIGLTGNIGCGKSTVARMLQELGTEVVDADRIAHQVMAPPGPVYDSIVREFGPGILAADGTIDRKKLAQIVFSHPPALGRLEALVHPATRATIRDLILNSRSRVVVVEAIKLIESGLHRECDAVWIVTCPREQQVARLVATRGLSVAEAELRINAQAPIAEKLPLADVIIDNSDGLEATRQQVIAAWTALVRT